MQDIVDNTTAVIFVKDLDLRYVLINREYERRFQVQRDQIRGKTDFDLYSHDVAQMVRANDRQVIEAGVPLQFDEVAPSALEGERSYVVVKFLLRDRTANPTRCAASRPTSPSPSVRSRCRRRWPARRSG